MAASKYSLCPYICDWFDNGWNAHCLPGWIKLVFLELALIVHLTRASVKCVIYNTASLMVAYDSMLNAKHTCFIDIRRRSWDMKNVCWNQGSIFKRLASCHKKGMAARVTFSENRMPLPFCLWYSGIVSWSHYQAKAREKSMTISIDPPRQFHRKSNNTEDIRKNA